MPFRKVGVRFLQWVGRNVSGVSECVVRAEVLLGILPLGGGNDFATALGLPDEPVKAAEAILQGDPRFVDLVRVRTAEGERACMQVGRHWP